MNIQVGKYVIKGGGASFDLYESKVYEEGKKKGQGYEVIVGYFYHLEDALKALVRESVLCSGATTLQSAVDLITEVKVDIDRSLGLKNVRVRKET
jgi:hypothetical protein